MLETTQQVQILYEDDNIISLWHPGRSTELLITFGDLITLAEGMRFFAETPVKKLNLNCIGFMAKDPNWYPAASMTNALEHLDSYIAKFQTRITYGGSMGGYAALKYSRLLGASHSIALCPQWSIDAAECDGINPGWQKFFVPQMRDMGILPSDMAGSIYVFFDPFEHQDKFHAQRIRRAWPETRLIRVPFVSHNVTPTMAGTKVLQALIAACLKSDLPSFYRLSRQQRRLIQYYRQEIADKAIRRRPRAMLRYLMAQQSSPDSFIPALSSHILRLAEHLVQVGDSKSSLACLKLLSNSHRSPVQKLILADLQARLSAGSARLRSFHDTVPVYDIHTGRCRHVPPEQQAKSAFLVPLTLHITGKNANFCLKTGPAEIRLGVAPSGELIVDTDTVADFKIIDAEDGQFYLHHEGKFLCAEPHSSLTCDRLTPQNWERFHFG